MKKLIIVIAAVALLASPALAVDWNFYGSARMATFYESRDYGDGQGDLSGKGTAFNGDQDEDTQLQWQMQTNSRLGATVKAVSLGLPTEVVVFMRGLFGVIILLPLLLRSQRYPNQPQALSLNPPLRPAKFLSPRHCLPVIGHKSLPN